MKTIRFVLAIAVVLSFFCGCKDLREVRFTADGRSEDRLGFKEHTIELETGSNESLSLLNSFMQGDNYYINVRVAYSDEESEERTFGTAVYVINLNSYEIERINLEADTFLSCVYNNSFCSVFRNTIILYDEATGQLNEEIDLPEISPIDDIIVLDTDMVITGAGYISRYDAEGCLVGRIEDNSINSHSQLFEQYNNIYLLSPADGQLNYYKADFDRHSLQRIAGSKDLGTQSSFCKREYIEDGYSIRKIDLTNQKIVLLSDFNYVDICPPKERLLTPTITSVLDDEHFAVINQYAQGQIEVQLFTYDPNIITVYERTITIGGFGCAEDSSIMWAVYLFNRSHNNVRALITDYTNEGFAFMNSVEAVEAKSELISYFCQGNSPDIFYGDAFDYNYFGRNGMAVDLLRYIGQDIDLMTDAAKEMIINPDGSCYRIFASYQVEGFMAQTDLLTEDAPSIYSIEGACYTDSSPLIAGLTYAQILDSIIRYEIPVRAFQDEDHYFTIDELTEALEFSIRNGYPDYETAGTLGFSGEPILSPVIIGDAEAYCTYYPGRRYIGYPSFGLPHKVARPYGLMAMSVSCSDPQLAWELMSYIFDPHIQMGCIEDWRFPVSDEAVEAYRNQAAAGEDHNYLERDALNAPERADEYFEVMLSADMLQTNDWEVFNIINDELQTYAQGKSIEQIAESLQSRLDLYIDENYK